MGRPSGEVRRWLADPRVRVVVLFVLLLMAVALAWHLVGMADHSVGMGMIGGACLALIVVGLIVLFRPAVLLPVALPAVPALPLPPRRLPPRFGRNPPREGVVLLM